MVKHVDCCASIATNVEELYILRQVSRNALLSSLFCRNNKGIDIHLVSSAFHKVSGKETTSSKKKRKGNIVLESLQRKQVEETISDEAYQRESQRMKEYSKFRLKELKLRRKREQDRLEAMRAAILALPEERKREVEEKVLTPVPFELPLFLETPAIPGYDPTLSDEAYQELSAEEVAVEKETIVVDRRRR